MISPPQSSPSLGSDSEIASKVIADRLAELPEDLLLRIFEIVGQASKRDLCNVSRLNHQYHAIADSILYKMIQFDRPEHHLRFSQSLGRRPRRGSLIMGVRLDYPGGHGRKLSQINLDVPVIVDEVSHLEHPSSRFDVLTRMISTMSNLEMLEISMPDSLLHGIGGLFNGPFDLACLKTCTLFYQCPNDAYWDLKENIHIFSHPTLESLIIRKAKLDYKGFDFLEKPEKTSLEKLHLIECDISDDALGDILEFPEALKEFVMTHLPEPHPDLEESSDNAGDYIIALQGAAHSLETVVLDIPTLGGRRAMRMREFAALKTLRLSWDYQLMGKTSKKPRMQGVGLPPELETLEFFCELGTDEEVSDLFLNAIENKKVMARNLKSLIVVEGEDRRIPKELIEACKSQDIKLDIIGGTLDEDLD
ncbi:hypothetical protein ACKVWC_004400 [Pyricularia oryzae]|uniref:F-box domain-containing protein n=2 Tax=Pyricularia oryzae TaxID=318829 RepID=A0AA97PJZ2_PYRO3|nr:hypothetical protein OOU_Y34scaffold00590g15 [Pyricularia oryzae Y34]KAI7932717.1 hypothetical protein M0657_000026 [Pyricularia oryzae]